VRLVVDGRVEVNGKAVVEPGTRVGDADEVAVDGKVVEV